MEQVLKVDYQKADDAEVPTHLWDGFYVNARHRDLAVTLQLPVGWRNGLAMFRHAFLRRWRLQLLRSWSKFSHNQAFMIIGFCLSLRGEEVPLVVIEGILQFWDETREHDIPHMMITLRGKFKGENNLRWHCLPLAEYQPDDGSAG